MHSITGRQLAPGMRPDEKQGPMILGATLTVTIAALLTTVARLYVRLNMIRNIGWDDYVMVFAMALCLAGQGVVISQVHHGAGRHIEYIHPIDIGKGLKMNFVSQPIYLWGIALVKISVGFFLLRIAVSKFYRRLIISIMVFMGVYTFGCFMTILLQCTDIRIMWDPTIKATCWTASTIKALGYTNAGFNISTDLAFAIFIPIPMLWEVQMNRRHKASLVCILGLGIFATAAAVVKLTYLPNYGKTGDWLWDSRNITIWTIAECNIGIIAGNLPCLKPIFRTVLGSTYGRGSRKTTNRRYSSRPYGPGTNNRSDAKNYASIHSNKTTDGDFKGYGAAGDAYMLTTIDAKKDCNPSKNNSGRSSPMRASSESIIRQDNKAHAFSGLGGIEVTTKVDVESSHSPTDKYEHAIRQNRADVRHMI